MITRKHKITAILIGQILLLLVIFQFGQIWWLGLIAICIGLLPWLAGGPQPSIVTAQPTDDVRLSSEQQQLSACLSRF